MILNVSGRCDIVAFYSKWFMNRYKEGFVDTRNPFYPKLVSRIYFKDVELIVFCTKNPEPIISYLKDISQKILFHVTLTPYKEEIEPRVLHKEKIIDNIKKISKIIGKDNIYVRYDPIFLSDDYDLSYHEKAFSKMCSLLKGYVKHIIISFLDEYKNTKNNRHVLKYKYFTESDYEFIGKTFSRIAKENDMDIRTCYEKRNLVKYGFLDDVCVSRELAYKMTGKIYKKWTARNCGCCSMVDIGEYNSCNHLCKYCYANFDESLITKNMKNHDPDSSLLIGHLKDDDEIKVRTM